MKFPVIKAAAAASVAISCATFPFAEAQNRPVLIDRQLKKGDESMSFFHKEANGASMPKMKKEKKTSLSLPKLFDTKAEKKLSMPREKKMSIKGAKRELFEFYGCSS